MNGHDSMVAASVERMLADGGAGDGWATLAASGVPRLLRPEGEGGAGDAWCDAAQVLQVVGRLGVELPLADTMLAHAWLAAAGLDADERPIRVSVAAADGTPDPADEDAAGGGGTDRDASADAVHRLRVEPWDDVARFAWRRADAGDGAAEQRFELADAARVRAGLALAGAAVLTGALRATIDAGLDYAGLRRAFGRPIGSFQAVQHPLVVAAEEVAAARAALDWAASALEAGDGAFATAVAKARASDAAGRVAATVHQVHGAIGFTAEHPLHRHTRLLWRWRDRWGDETHWHRVVGAVALAAGPDALFDVLDGRDGR